MFFKRFAGSLAALAACTNTQYSQPDRAHPRTGVAPGFNLAAATSCRPSDSFGSHCDRQAGLRHSVSYRASERGHWVCSSPVSAEGAPGAMPPTRVTVVGAGIIGLSTAYRILTELANTEVTVVADKFSPNTTSDGAAGLFEPYFAGETPKETMLKWCVETWIYLRENAKSEHATKSGVFPISGFSLTATIPAEKPYWCDIVQNFRELSNDEVLEFATLGAKYGCFFTTFICECSKHLPFLLERFLAAGGRVKHMKLSSLSEVSSDCDIIVNCSGIQARDLVGDLSVYPVRGHTLRVKANNVKTFYIVDCAEGSTELTYILPNADTVVLGGTCQKGDWRVTSESVESQDILARCSQVLPHLQHAEIVRQWTGLRPGRPQVRLELEMIVLNGKMMPVVHNYGHGGSGVTLFWGCAADARDIISQLMASKTKL